MSEPMRISPLLDGFIVGETISDHHGVRCCPAIRENTDERYIVKIISIPASQAQLDALLLSGAYSNQEQVLDYFKDLADGVVAEIDILSRLSKQEGFIPYSQYQIEQMDDGVGYEVYLLCPYKHSLEKQLHTTPPTQLGAVNLGLDLCAALAVCRRAGYLYADLKPDNIYLTQTQGYRIGDLGFIPLKSLKYASLPEKYRSSYTAPEISDAMSELNDTLDIYALGLTLYQVYNNGQLPFEGNAPNEVLPPPLYADYEMAEIILKACAPNPRERWQDPVQMGQALVNYMQRNGVNDIPIVPPPFEPPVETEEEPEEFLSEEENAAQMAELLDQLPEDAAPETEEGADADISAEITEDSTEDISFIDDDQADETLPTEESAVGLEDTEVSEDVAQMLEQADDLIDHELPEPVVVPEPIDVPIPPPIPTEDEDESEEPKESDESEETNDTEEEEVAESEESAEETSDKEAVPMSPVPNPNKKKIIRICVMVTTALLLLAALIGGFYYYYNFHYLQSIDDIQVSGTATEMTVELVTDIDESLLTVIYTDTYGNTAASGVTDGVATFSRLIPNTLYRISVKISGTHKLLGAIATNYTTATQTEILNYTATAGPEDGSVILSFSVNGPESDAWIVSYAAMGIEEKSQTFTGHTVTITGLTIGADYAFRLTPSSVLYLTGNHQINYTPQKIVYAQDLIIDSCGNGSLTATWNAPEGAHGQVWTVRCYNDVDFDVTITTSDCFATFDGLNHDTGYTVKVTASGMTQSVSTSVSPNPVTITEFSTDTSVPGELKVSWAFDGSVPTQGWELSYSIDGTPLQTLTCTDNTATLPYYPGSKYTFHVKPIENITYFGEPFTFEAPKATPFEGYLVTGSDMDFAMIVKPDAEHWDRYSLAPEDYKTKFNADESVAFLVHLLKQYNTSEDMIVTSYIIRNHAGQPVSLNTEQRTWGDMWDGGYCHLEVPEMPTTVGEFTIEIYFNGHFVTTQEFSIEHIAP